MTAIAAVDTALWDIKAKAANLPLYQLLGGRSRDGVMVYGHANGNDIAETLDEVARYVDMGYKAIRAQCGVPGLAVDLRRGQATSSTTSRPTRRCPPRTSGRRRAISTTRRSCSKRSARASASITTSCTTCIIA